MKATALDFQPVAAPRGQALDFKRLMQKALDGVRRSVAPGPARQAATPSPRPKAVQGPTARSASTVLGAQPLGRIGLVAASPTSEVLATARGAMNAEAARLQQERGEAQGVVEEKLDARLLEVICRELTVELGGGSPGARRDPSFPSTQPSRRAEAKAVSEPGPSLKAAAVAALVDRIETMVKAGRPALAVQLNHPSLERAEIERVGPREIALRLLGKNGPPPADAIGRIREELAERGLKLAALTVG